MEYDFRIGDKTHAVAAERKGDGWLISVGGRTVEADVVDAEPCSYSVLTADGATAVVVVRDGSTRYVALDGHIITLEEAAAEGFAAGRDDEVVGGVQTIKAPMPGKVVKITAAEGAEVAKGQTVVIVEAMKMEHPLGAAGAGTVRKIVCAEGQNVDANQLLAEVLIGSAS